VAGAQAPALRPGGTASARPGAPSGSQFRSCSRFGKRSHSPSNHHPPYSR
jgi:hypothetical protein